MRNWLLISPCHRISEEEGGTEEDRTHLAHNHDPGAKFLRHKARMRRRRRVARIRRHDDYKSHLAVAFIGVLQHRRPSALRNCWHVPRMHDKVQANDIPILKPCAQKSSPRHAWCPRLLE